MKRLFLGGMLALAAGMAAQAQPAAPGSNPIIRDQFTADPAALVVGDTVYLYVGHDVSDVDRYRMPDWLLYSSKDMKHWTPHGTILRPTDFAWSKGDAYASQVVEKGGKFYFYANAKETATGSMAIGVAVSDKPTGPFVDARGSVLITNAMTPQGKHDWSDIDPTVLIDDDGTPWLMWGNGNCFRAKLKPNMIELDGPIEEVKLTRYEEGPWLHKHGKTYYLTYASRERGPKEPETISYATAPAVTGPWTYRGELTGPAENSGTIHPAIISFKGKDYFFYHDGTLTIGDKKGGSYRRAVRVERLFYNADGTMKPVAQTAAGVSGRD